MEIFRYTRQNRDAWNEIAGPRRRKAPPPEFFADGKSTLERCELEAAGDVRGKRLLHLQCAHGSETLSWAVAGAVCTGVDVSGVAIDIARDQAARAGLQATFVVSDVYELPASLQAGDFDVVYASAGVLCWLPDLAAWAHVVARALRSGGILLLYEHHPVRECLQIVDGRWTVTADYFGRSAPVRGEGLGVLACGTDSHEHFFTFSWPIGDILTSLIRAGMRIDLLEEQPTDPPYYAGTATPELTAELRRLPGSFILKATRSGT